MKENNIYKGRICEIQRQLFTIDSEYGIINAQLKGFFYNEVQELPVIGDYILYEYNPYGNSTIREILERKNTLKRPDQSGHGAGYVKTMKEQALAANFDSMFIVSSLNQEFNLSRITRYVTVALQSKAKPVVILTKADLCEHKNSYLEEVASISDQVEVIALSAITGEGMDELQSYLQDDITILLMGSSGVGKSTLLNAIADKNIMKVSEIRESDAKGHHTTTHRQLIKLPTGITMIDSPGIRELGMCLVDEGLENTFADILDLMNGCRFSNCKHKTEPGCAILQSLEDGSLTQERWKMYQNLHKENRWANAKLKPKKVKTVKKPKIINNLKDSI